MRKLLLINLFILVVAFTGCKKDDTDSGELAVLTTTALSNVTPTSASCGGVITADGGSTVTARGVCWNTFGNATVEDAKTEDGTGIGSFTSQLTGLTLNTTYYVRAYATNSKGTAYGNQISFSPADIPVVSTLPVYDIAGNSAWAECVIVNDGGGFLSGFGLCWSLSPGPTVEDDVIANGYTVEMAPLAPNNVYYVRAFATNIAGTGYGQQYVFNSGYVFGTFYSEGLVFYNSGDDHGLVCATSDQEFQTAKWGCEEVFIGGTSAAVNTGAANTVAIVNGCGDPTIAAAVSYNAVIGAYDDWYLPSKDELILMNKNLHEHGMGSFSVLNAGQYWSSTQYDYKYAWLFQFANGAATTDYKDSSLFFFNVRSVRSF